MVQAFEMLFCYLPLETFETYRYMNISNVDIARQPTRGRHTQTHTHAHAHAHTHTHTHTHTHAYAVYCRSLINSDVIIIVYMDKDSYWINYCRLYWTSDCFCNSVTSALSSLLTPYVLLYKCWFCGSNNCLRPYHPEHARSRLISEAKQGRAWLVLGWETAWEYQVL